MLKGITESGFEFEIDEESLDDWELLELLQEIDDGNIGKLSKAIVFMLGEEQYTKLKNFIKARDGKIKASVMVDEFSSIMNANKEIKN